MPNYDFKTTFWEDFTIADAFGNDAIKDTFKRAFDGWKTNVEYLAELVLVLNWKGWQWYEKDEERSKIYFDIYQKADDYAYKNLKGEDLNYYFHVTD